MIFATGMTGMIGRILAERMSGTGATVRALVRDFDKAADLRRLGIETVTGDLANREMLEQAMRGTSDVLMLSSMAQNQVELQGNLIRAAKAVGVPHLVKVSAINAGEDAPLELARLHGQTEREMTDIASDSGHGNAAMKSA